jgi:hypothetical protein
VGIEHRDTGNNEDKPEIGGVPSGAGDSQLDSMTAGTGYGTGLPLQRDPDRSTAPYALGNNLQAGYGEESVAALQRYMAQELDPDWDGNQYGNTSVLPGFGIDGAWGCETQTAYNNLLKQKGVECNSSSSRTCGGRETPECQLDEKTLDELKKKDAEKKEEEKTEEEKEEEGPTEEEEQASKKEEPTIPDQCILISNLDVIKDSSKPPVELPSFYEETGTRREDIKYKNMHKIVTEDPSTLMNRLRMTQGAFQFLNIRHWQLSQLVPIVKIYKQYPQGGGKPPREVEMKFNTFVDPITDLQEMLNSQSQRGVGVGIESLDYTFIGTNPDTAKRQIQGNLVIYAQNFNELFKTRRGFDQDGVEFEGGYRIIDLVRGGLGGFTEDQKSPDPNNFTLKIVVGWGATGGGGTLEPELVSALKDTQITMIVTVGDYDLNIMDEQGGAVRFILDFYPRIEAVSLTNDSDVLANQETRKKRKERKKIFGDLITSQKEVDPESASEESTSCFSEEQITELKRMYDADVAKDLEESSQSLLAGLLESNLIYTARINAGDTKIDLTSTSNKEIPLEILTSGCAEEHLQDLKDSATKPDTREIMYFFLGDLIALALNNVLDENERPEMQDVYYGNIKYVLGPITIPGPDGQERPPMNIGDIPISVDLFADFMNKKLPRHIESGTSWPLYLFTRQVIKELVFEAMGPDCFDGTSRLGANLETATLSADPAAGGIDPIEAKISEEDAPEGKKKKKSAKKSKQANSNEAGSPRIPPNALNLDKFGINLDDPSKSTFVFDSFNQTSLRDKYTYFIIYATNNKSISLGPPPKGTTRFERDHEVGIYHITSGLDRGLMKSVNFSRAGMPAVLRSARIMENRNMPDLQLANNFQISVDMYGNNLFYPGSYVYLDPRGLGADLIGNPDDRETPSIANILGIGGYHSIGKVKNTINMNGFSTTLDATFFNNGSATNKMNVSPSSPAGLSEARCPDDAFGAAQKELGDALVNNGDNQ